MASSANTPGKMILHLEPLAILAGCCLFTYLVATVIYRLYFSPLASFPGPTLAAATFWYEFYYDVVLKGKYTFKLKELHKKYGSIIRINPYELHVSDPEFYNTLYSHSCPRDKWSYYIKPFDFPQSSFGTENSQLHRLRRGAMNPFFSRGKVLQNEDLVQRLVHKFCNRIENFEQSGNAVPLSLGFTCLTTDLITEFVMDRSYGYLEAPDWHPHWGQTLRDASELATVSRQVTWILPILKYLPRSWAESINPGLVLFFSLVERTHERISDVHHERYMESKENMQHTRKKTLIDQVLDSKLPDVEKSAERLAAEIRSAIGAGTETTSNALTVITYHLLGNPDKLQRLREELSGLEYDLEKGAKLCELEQLPYLSSCILEGLRLSYGVSTRLQRVTGPQPLMYRGYNIPPGTAIGMTSVLQHHDESIFPNSHAYIPERWLDADERKRLDKYLVTFSKGSRRCIGMNLALAELYVTVASLFQRFQLELYDTTHDDVDISHDLFIPRPKNLRTLGVQAIVRRRGSREGFERECEKSMASPDQEPTPNLV